MSMKPEDYEEFQRQLDLQKQAPEPKTLTKKDEDGVEYEWDAEKKAWFPKLSVDQILQYQSNYSAANDESTDADKEAKPSSSTPASYMDPLTKTKYIWDEKSNQWQPDSTLNSDNYPDNFKYTDPSTGNVYRWEAKTKSWQSDGQVMNSTQEDGEPNAGKITYVHTETKVKYTWDEKEQVWKADDGEVLLPATDWSSQESYTDPESGKTFTWDKDSQSWKETTEKQAKKKQKSKPPQKRVASKSEWFDVDKEKNTSVYVTGLPPDITPQEFVELMSKCGIIMPHPQTGEPKLKLYLDKIGNPKGDGLCSYLKRESVELAMQLLDDMEMRNGHKVHIQEAEFQLKGQYDASKKPKMLSKKEKKKFQKDQEKLLDWKLNRAEDPVTKTDRVVILKHMFDTAEFEEDPVLITDIRDDLKKECEKFGAVKKVLVFDRHPEGVCSVAFKEAEAAVKCRKALNGRWFAGRSVLAIIWDGVTNYQIEETDKEREQRIAKWENYLDKGGDGKNDPEANSQDAPSPKDPPAGETPNKEAEPPSENSESANDAESATKSESNAGTGEND